VYVCVYIYTHTHTHTKVTYIHRATEALEMLLTSKCIDMVFNRYYEADFSLKVQKKIAENKSLNIKLKKSNVGVIFCAVSTTKQQKYVKKNRIYNM